MFGPRHEHRLSIILTETKRLTRGARVLDAAVGLGQLAQRLERQGLRPFGIDSAFEAVLHARRTGGIPVVLGDLTKLPFRSASFDGVTTGETLEHLDNDAGAAREIGRVLKDDDPGVYSLFRWGLVFKILFLYGGLLVVWFLSLWLLCRLMLMTTACVCRLHFLPAVFMGVVLSGGRRRSFFTRTTTHFTTSPRLTAAPGMASFTVATKMSPIDA